MLAILFTIIAVVAAQNWVSASTYKGTTCTPNHLQVIATTRTNVGQCLNRTVCACANGYCVQTWCSPASSGLIVPAGAVGFLHGTSCNAADATTFAGFGYNGACVAGETAPSYSVSCSGSGLRVRTYSATNDCTGTVSEITYSGCSNGFSTTCDSGNSGISSGSNSVTLTVNFDATVTTAQAAALQSAIVNYLNGAATVTVVGGGSSTLVITITGTAVGGAGATIVGNFNVNANIFQSLVVSFSSDTSVAALPTARSVSTGASGLLASFALLLLALAMFL